MSKAILLLGSNIHDRKKNLEIAVQELSKTGTVDIISSIYESEPWGFKAKDSFYNQVVILKTQLSPQTLLEQIHYIENNLGRVRNLELYESRTIDIDILFYDDLVIDSQDLSIPHPAIHKRRFTLEPLHEILPEFVHPVLGKSIKKLLIECPDNLWVKKCSD